MAKSKSKTQELCSRYQFGSLYVTYIPINDLTQLLNDAARCLRFKQLTSDPGAIDAFKTFLDKIPIGPINEGIAFVQLDLVKGQAGFKKISDRDGVIHNIAWSSKQVEGIAELCDAYFTRFSEYEAAYNLIQTGVVPLKDAWERVADLQGDPFVTNVRSADLLGNFKVLVDQKQTELKGLKLDDAATYGAIRKVTDEYDKYLKEQRHRKDLVDLWSKEKEIRKKLEGVNLARVHISELLDAKTTRRGLKDATVRFENLGFLNLNTSDATELFQVNKRLRSHSTGTRIDLPTGTTGFGTTKLQGFSKGFSGKGRGGIK
jgi:hypothetical protein